MSKKYEVSIQATVLIVYEVEADTIEKAENEGVRLLKEEYDCNHIEYSHAIVVEEV